MLRRYALCILLFASFVARAAAACDPASAPYGTFPINARASVVGAEVTFTIGSFVTPFPPAFPYQITDCDIAQWNFGDGTPLVTQKATDAARHTFAHAGYYQIGLVVANAAGPEQSASGITIGSNPPTIIDLPNASVSESAGAVDYVVHRRNNLTTTATITYESEFPNEVFDNGIGRVAGTLVFAPGETDKTIHIALINDNDYRGDQSRGLRFTATDGTYLDVDPRYDAHAKFVEITMHDDDPPPVATITGETRLLEGSGRRVVQFDLTLSKIPVVSAYISGQLIDGTAHNGVDFESFNGGAFFENGGTFGHIDILIIGNSKPERDKTFTLRLQPYNVTLASATDILCTIVHDYTGFVPDSVRVPAGTTVSLHFETGLFAASPSTITFTSDAPDVAAAPAPISLPATSFDVPVTTTREGVAHITAHFAGHADTQATVIAFESSQLLLQPLAPLFATDSHGTLTLSIQPPRNSPQTVTLESDTPAVATVVSPVVIPAGATVPISISTHAAGEAVITARLANPLDSLVAYSSIVTSESAPHLQRLEPAVGAPEGGTIVKISGRNLATSCSVTFDGTSANVLSGDVNTLLVRAPSHANGVVDFEVTCSGWHSVSPNGFQFAHVRRHAS